MISLSKKKGYRITQDKTIEEVTIGVFIFFRKVGQILGEYISLESGVKQFNQNLINKLIDSLKIPPFCPQNTEV
jgi:hypothetical protein